MSPRLLYLALFLFAFGAYFALSWWLYGKCHP